LQASSLEGASSLDSSSRGGEKDRTSSSSSKSVKGVKGNSN
jgi:hypothetical protein